MKYLAIMLAAGGLNVVAQAGPIVQKPLDEFVIYDIPVAQKPAPAKA